VESPILRGFQAVEHNAWHPRDAINLSGTPLLGAPLNGASILSSTRHNKWIGVHGLSIGGASIDSGKFDWKASGRSRNHRTGNQPTRRCFRGRSRANGIYHCARVVVLRDFGGRSAFNSFLTIVGPGPVRWRVTAPREKTLALSHLEQLRRSKRSTIPACPAIQSGRARKYMPNGAGA